jgi:hypothetical protein
VSKIECCSEQQHFLWLGFTLMHQKLLTAPLSREQQDLLNGLQNKIRHIAVVFEMYAVLLKRTIVAHVLCFPK